MSTARCWVLLRGLTRERGHWGDFPARLQAALPGDSVLAFDLPGNGSLNRQESPVRVEAMADELRAALHAAGHAPPYSVLAMSLGAMVTVAWAARHPQELSRAVLINTSLRPFSPFWQRLRPRNYAPLLRLMFRGASAREWESTIFALTSRCVADADACIARWVALRESHPVSRRNALRQLLAALRFAAAREAPAVPLLVLASAQDQLVDPRCSRSLVRAWRCESAEHPAAGHDLPLDDADWIAQQIRTWLCRGEAARADGVRGATLR